MASKGNRELLCVCSPMRRRAKYIKLRSVAQEGWNLGQQMYLPNMALPAKNGRLFLAVTTSYLSILSPLEGPVNVYPTFDGLDWKQCTLYSCSRCSRRSL